MSHGPGTRRRDFDYSSPGYYFVTIVVEGRRPVLGRLTSSGVELSRIGRTAAEAWELTLIERPWIQVDAIVLMPDHIHAIVGWNDPPKHRAAGLGNFVGQFKGVATRICHERRLIPRWEKIWQSGFWDRVIRGPKELERIRKYVDANPSRAWLRKLGRESQA